MKEDDASTFKVALRAAINMSFHRYASSLELKVHRNF